MRKILFANPVAILIAAGNLMAQDRTLSGTVKDESGQGLPGVNILLKGTNRGTNPDGDGAFKLSVPTSGTLAFSSVGYETKEVAFNSSTFQMNVSTIRMPEQQVSGKSMQDVRDANFVNTLSGKVAGMVVTQAVYVYERLLKPPQQTSESAIAFIS